MYCRKRGRDGYIGPLYTQGLDIGLLGVYTLKINQANHIKLINEDAHAE